MVRHKARWLLIKIELENDLSTGPIPTAPREADNANTINSKDIYLTIREIVSSAFGIAGIGVIEGLQVRIYNPEAQLALLKVSRGACSMTRAAVTMITSIKSLSVVASTISVNGSVRTAKIAALYHIQKAWDRKLQYLEKNQNTSFNQGLYEKYYQELQRQKESIIQIE